jgi:hypothetical protein
MKEASAAVEDEEDITLTDRSLKDCWSIYLNASKSHTALTDDELVSMMQSLIDATNLLSDIDDAYYKLVSDNLKSKHFDLAVIAAARGIASVPVLPGTPTFKVV